MPKHKFQVKRIDNSTIVFDGQTLKKDKCSSCRDVFRNKEYVIKFDGSYYNDGYEEQCRDEYENWKEIRKTEYKKYFVPILQYGISGGVHYVVQPRVKLKGKKSKLFCEIKVKLANKFLLNDLHDGNYTTAGENLQIFDYAC
jgi:hypothetical protein